MLELLRNLLIEVPGSWRGFGMARVWQEALVLLDSGTKAPPDSVSLPRRPVMLPRL